MFLNYFEMDRGVVFDIFCSDNVYLYNYNDNENCYWL